MIISAALISCKKSEEKVPMEVLMEETMTAMHSSAQSGNIDKDFADRMAAHHLGAVKMSQLLLKESRTQNYKNLQKISSSLKIKR